MISKTKCYLFVVFFLLLVVSGVLKLYILRRFEITNLLA